MSWMTSKMVDLMGVMPASLIWRFAKRYIAGATMDDGMEVRRHLHGKGMLTTLDILGEDMHSLQDADLAAAQYLELLEMLERSGLPGNVSVKLTQLGLKLDFQSTQSRIENLVSQAAARRIFTRIDMEDASTTNQTLDIYKKIRPSTDLVGTVIQAYLKRSQADVELLLQTGVTNLRICKGIYNESPSIAYKQRQQIRDNYMVLLRLLFDAGAYAGIATHDRWLVKECLVEIHRRGLAKDRYEFQMLHGVGETLRRAILKDGHRLRIYVPFGSAWKAYAFRRFRENPTLAWYIVKNLIVS